DHTSRERVLQEVRREPTPEADGTAKENRHVRHEQPEEAEDARPTGSRRLAGLRGLRQGRPGRWGRSGQDAGTDGGGRGADHPMSILYRDPQQEGQGRRMHGGRDRGGGDGRRGVESWRRDHTWHALLELRAFGRVRRKELSLKQKLLTR